VCADVHCIKVALNPPKIAASQHGDGAASIELLDADSYTSRCVHNSGGCRWPSMQVARQWAMDVQVRRLSIGRWLPPRAC
jgi:hypothetical protein